MKVPSGKGRRVVKFDPGTGEVKKIYKELHFMAMDLDITNSAAYYKIKSQKPYLDYRYMYEEDFIKLYPIPAERAGLIKSEPEPEPDEIVIKPDNKKAEYEGAKEDMKKNENKKAEAADSIENTCPEKSTSKPFAANHNTNDTGGITGWDSLVKIFGPEWMRAYANIEAFIYSSEANQSVNFAEYMRKAAWYSTKAADLEESING